MRSTLTILSALAVMLFSSGCNKESSAKKMDASLPTSNVVAKMATDPFELDAGIVANPNWVIVPLVDRIYGLCASKDGRDFARKAFSARDGRLESPASDLYTHRGWTIAQPGGQMNYQETYDTNTLMHQLLQEAAKLRRDGRARDAERTDAAVLELVKFGLPKPSPELAQAEGTAESSPKAASAPAAATDAKQKSSPNVPVPAAQTTTDSRARELGGKGEQPLADKLLVNRIRELSEDSTEGARLSLRIDRWAIEGKEGDVGAEVLVKMLTDEAKNLRRLGKQDAAARTQARINQLLAGVEPAATAGAPSHVPKPDNAQRLQKIREKLFELSQQLIKLQSEKGSLIQELGLQTTTELFDPEIDQIREEIKNLLRERLRLRQGDKPQPGAAAPADKAGRLAPETQATDNVDVDLKNEDGTSFFTFRGPLEELRQEVEKRDDSEKPDPRLAKIREEVERLTAERERRRANKKRDEAQHHGMEFLHRAQLDGAAKDMECQAEQMRQQMEQRMRAQREEHERAVQEARERIEQLQRGGLAPGHGSGPADAHAIAHELRELREQVQLARKDVAELRRIVEKGMPIQKDGGPKGQKGDVEFEIKLPDKPPAAPAAPATPPSNLPAANPPAPGTPQPAKPDIKSGVAPNNES